MIVLFWEILSSEVSKLREEHQENLNLLENNLQNLRFYYKKTNLEEIEFYDPMRYIKKWLQISLSAKKKAALSGVIEKLGSQSMILILILLLLLM